MAMEEARRIRALEERVAGLEAAVRRLQKREAPKPAKSEAAA